MPHLITLTGPSGCGKSTCLRYFLGAKRATFDPVVLRKFSTRAVRPNDGPEIVAGCKTLPNDCDLIYEQYGDRYGLPMSSVFEALGRGQSPLLILNDVRTVEDVRHALGPQARSVFLFRQSPSLEKFRNLAVQRRSVDPTKIEQRFRKAEAIYRIYIENIYLFDHVIVNAFALRHLRRQVRAVVNGLAADGRWPLHGVG